MSRTPLLRSRDGWTILALAAAGAILYALIQEQYARLSITFAVVERAVKIRSFLEQLPIDIWHGRGMAPWQYRFVVYGPVGWLLERGVPAIPLDTAYRTFFLFTWALAVQALVRRWFPSLESRALAVAACFLLGILAIPWYIYNLDDFPMLTALTIALIATFDDRVWLACLAAACATACKESVASFWLAWLLFHQPWTERRMAPWLRAGMVAAASMLPAAVQMLAFTPQGSHVGVHFPVNLDWRLVNNLPLVLVLIVSLPAVRAARFSGDLRRVTPWFLLYALEVLAFGMMAELRIWYPLALLVIPLLLHQLNDAPGAPGR